MLVHPDDVVPDVEPGFYLYGSPRFQKMGPLFTCRHMSEQNLEMSTLRHTDDLEVGSFFILGPYKDPSTGRLMVRCMDIQRFDIRELMDIDNLGTAFLHTLPNSDYAEKITPVPNADMLDKAAGDCRWAQHSPHVNITMDGTFRFPWRQLATKFDEYADQIDRDTESRNQFHIYCLADTVFARKMKRLARIAWEYALYGRQWAGPDRKTPVTTLAGSVANNPRNPLSQKIKNRYVRATPDGPKLSNTANEYSLAAWEGDGLSMLTNMVYASAESIVLLYESLADREREMCRSVWGMGLPFWMIDDSGYWVSFKEVNHSNGNGLNFPLNIFSQMGGRPGAGRSGLVATHSVVGDGDYCIQIASSHMGRIVLTMIPYLFKSRPMWSRGDGMDQFPTLHTA